MTFEDSIVIDAPPALLFELSQDYNRRLGWDPFLRSAELLNGAVEPAVGVRALCVDQKGTAMETEYVSFNPPRAAAVKMTRGPWFLESFAGSWRFEEVNAGQTRVGFCYSLRARPWWLGLFLNPVLRQVFARYATAAAGAQTGDRCRRVFDSLYLSLFHRCWSARIGMGGECRVVESIETQLRDFPRRSESER